MILDLGCGITKVAGAVGMDNVELPGVDIVHDLLAFPYPFDGESADEIYLNHVIEHFTLTEGQSVLREAYRILRPEGVLRVRVPHVFTVAAWADPTHRSSFTFVSGEFFDSRSAKSYYKELNARWRLTESTARVTCFNWKRYRLRQLDNWISGIAASLLNRLLRMTNWPGGADLLVKWVPMFFVEIRWDLRKAESVV
jgi:SAM-dependent methyltransferase